MASALCACRAPHVPRRPIPAPPHQQTVYCVLHLTVQAPFDCIGDKMSLQRIAAFHAEIDRVGAIKVGGSTQSYAH